MQFVKFIKITGFVLTGIIVLFLGLCFYGKRLLQQESTIEIELLRIDKTPNEYAPIIPIQIQDSTYYFLWDTGCSSCYIHSDLANSLNSISKTETRFYHVEKLDSLISKTIEKKTNP